MNKMVALLVQKFEKTVKESRKYSIFSRDIDLQKNETVRLTALYEELRKNRTEAKNRMPEADLNLILYLEYVVFACVSEIKMLIHLKENHMDLAWNELINAQNSISTAIGNSPPNAPDLKWLEDRFKDYEVLLFPKMYFGSAGFIAVEIRCSICNSDYNDCTHIAGKFYQGEVCISTIEKAQLEEVSIVENPADKRCRLISIPVNGKNVDPLTFKEV